MRFTRLGRERSWNGVAIPARKREPVLIRDALPGDVDDKQSRYIEAAVEGVAIVSLYLVNGNPQSRPKFEYKFAWFDRLDDHASKLLAQDVPAVLAGDYNVVPHGLRHLRDAIFQGQRAVAAGAPRGLGEAVGGRLDGRAVGFASGRSDVHLLELSQKPPASRRWP